MLIKSFLIIIFKLIFIFLNLRHSLGNNITNGLVAYWNFDDNDNWMNPIFGGESTSIGGGTPSRSTSFKKFGTSSLFLNGNSWLSIPTPGTWLPAGSSAYSISLWFYRATAFPNERTNFIQWGPYTSSKMTGIHTINSAGGIRSYWWLNDLDCSSTDCPLSINTWYHVVDTFDGITHKLYLNGVLKSFRTPSGKAAERSNFLIGYASGYSWNWNGYIDDLGIYNRALTVAEVQFLCNSSIMSNSIAISSTPNVTNGLVAYWNFDDNDNWMNPAYGGQLTSIGDGTPSRSTSFKVFGSGSLYLNGNSWLSIPTPGTWLPAGSSAYSISLWFYRPVAFTTDFFFIVHWGPYVLNKATGLHTQGSQGGIENYWWGNDLECTSATCPLSNNTWYHVVATYDGTTHKTYINGIEKLSRIASGRDTERTNFNIGFGGNNTEAAWRKNWNGYIDDLGIYNRALTLTEVQTLYNSAIIPIYDTNGLVVYWNFDDNDNWMNPAYGGELTSIGDGTPSRSTFKMFGSGSLYLDGNSWLSIPNPGTWLPAGSSAYSISLWVYRPVAFTAQQFVIIYWGSLANSNKATGIHTLNAVGGIRTFWMGSSLDCSSTDCPLSLNTWYHVVDTYDGRNQKLYLNGILKAIRTASGKITERTNFNVGYNGGTGCCQNWNGYIDDLGIYNRALTLTEVQTLYTSSIQPSPVTVSDQINKLNTDIAGIKNNMSSQISNLVAEISSHKNDLLDTKANINLNITNLSTQISNMNQQLYNIKTNTSEILLEISKIKLSLQKTIATLTKLRKRDRSKKTVEL